MDCRVKRPHLATGAEIDHELPESGRQQVGFSGKDEKEMIEGRSENKPKVVPLVADLVC